MTDINNIDIIYVSTSVADCKEVVQCTDETLIPMRVFFLPFVKSIKVFDEKYFESRNPNMEIILFWTKV